MLWLSFCLICSLLDILIHHILMDFSKSTLFTFMYKFQMFYCTFGLAQYRPFWVKLFIKKICLYNKIDIFHVLVHALKPNSSVRRCLLLVLR